MHLEAVDETMVNLTKKLAFIKEFSFHLSGGTGLALQIGHRRSFDMDFFTPHEFLPDDVAATLTAHHLSVESRMIRPKTLYCILEGVKTSFIFYPEPLLFPLKTFNTIEIADWRDIVIEKLRTIADRGQKKDFYDFYFGLQKIGIEQVTKLAFRKFGNRVNYFHLLKGLTYFEDADRNPEPILIGENIPWSKIKEFFLKSIKDFETYFSNLC
ncbi:MAG: nucleotidyl transferase AbiEii/AbiGii toxin family protein [Thermodesulfovibrionales bacterium]